MTRLLRTAAVLALSLPLPALAQNAGGEADVTYASMLWDQMVEVGLAGEGAIMAFPYDGVEPHGMMLETFYTKATVDGHTGALIVKRNYGPEGVEIDQVLGDPVKHLGALTVMFSREAGYDDENQNWFWAKYLPDGSLDKNPKGMSLAGRVGKGADVGCIACHAAADGEDYLFTTNAIKSGM